MDCDKRKKAISKNYVPTIETAGICTIYLTSAIHPTRNPLASDPLLIGFSLLRLQVETKLYWLSPNQCEMVGRLKDSTFNGMSAQLMMFCCV